MTSNQSVQPGAPRPAGTTYAAVLLGIRCDDDDGDSPFGWKDAPRVDAFAGTGPRRALAARLPTSESPGGEPELRTGVRQRDAQRRGTGSGGA